MTTTACATDTVRRLCIEAGACGCGIAGAGAVAEGDMELLDAWLADGRSGCLDYMARYRELRADPRTLLEGARSLVVCAFACRQEVHSPHIADFALGSDYHTVLRERLEGVAAAIRRLFGGETRVCVDSAPLRERYWAVRSGLGTTGVNGKLFVPGAGCDVLIASILTTASLPPTAERPQRQCTGCGRCVAACPAHALDGRGGVDARRCLACLTIEQRSALPDGTDLHGHLVGCDVCSRVCPANTGTARTPDELLARPDVLAVTPESAAGMGRGAFAAVFAGTAVMRLRHTGLRRNARAIINYNNTKP